MRQVLRELARPRYAALSALMLIVAAICVLAGTWQIFRYDGKHLSNDELRANAHAAAAPVDGVLPVVRDGAAPSADAVEFRSVTATGTYDAADELLVRQQQVDDVVGYVVLTPLRTTTGTSGAAGSVLLVARGFVPDTSSAMAPADVTPPPTGEVTVTGRVQLGSTDDDRFALLHNGQVDVVNPASASARLGAAVYDGYVELEAGQAGTSGLTALPAPDLSNPAGGAFELQHLAYVVQWYLFAGLALAAPLVMVRTDHRRAREDAEARGIAVRAIATRRARQQALSGGADTDDAGGALVRVDPAAQQAVEDRLAERYGN